mgnify:CR=1 FL=1
MSTWTKEEEAAFRGAPHRWTYNEKLMLDEIEELRTALEKTRAELKEEQEGRMNFFLQHGQAINAALDD